MLAEEHAWSDVIRESQEIVELALKGMLRQIGIDPPKWHDVGTMVEAHRDRLPPQVAAQAGELARISARLRKEREFAFYGDIDFIPTEQYSEADATLAIQEARITVDAAAADSSLEETALGLDTGGRFRGLVKMMVDADLSPRDRALLPCYLPAWRRGPVMNVTIPKSLEALVREKVEEGHYSTEDEVVADALRLMQARDDVAQIKRARLKEAIARGDEEVTAGRVLVLENEDQIDAFFADL